MTTHGTGTFKFTRWDETPYSEIEGGTKLTHASVTNTFRGDIEGEGTLNYLMAYPGGDVSFIGFEQIVGHLAGRKGSFVLQHRGTFAVGAATCTWSVVPGSGTGELQRLRGEGGYVANHEQPTPFTLDFDFESGDAQRS